MYNVNSSWEAQWTRGDDESACFLSASAGFLSGSNSIRLSLIGSSSQWMEGTDDWCALNSEALLTSKARLARWSWNLPTSWIVSPAGSSSLERHSSMDLLLGYWMAHKWSLLVGSLLSLGSSHVRKLVCSAESQGRYYWSTHLRFLQQSDSAQGSWTFQPGLRLTHQQISHSW